MSTPQVAGPAPQPILSIRGIVKHFGGVVAVEGASFDIERGSITGLIGPNGAGKTTLFNIIAGVFKPDRGEVLFDGQDVTGLLPHKLFDRGLVRTFQIPHAFERMTVLDNLMVVPGGQGGENLFRSWLRWGSVKSEETQISSRAHEVLDFLQIEHLRDEYAGTLSGGQKKLLELGRTMMTDARLVLLDEPGAGVNPTLMVKLRSDIRRLNEERGYTFCIIEHDMDTIAELCQPIVVMAEGRVLTIGTMDEIRANEEVLDAYLGGKKTAAVAPPVKTP